MEENILKLAKILRTNCEVIEKMNESMSDLFDKTGVIPDLLMQNASRIDTKINELGIKTKSFEEILNALFFRAKALDGNFIKLFGQPDFSNETGSKKIINVVREASGGMPVGFFLKREKAKEMLLLNPPQKVVKFFGYRDIEELIEKEDLFEIFPALRFVEDRDWLNGTFFSGYAKLRPEDFQKREIQIRPMGARWMDIGHKFVEKKFHNVSHLKELGLIFILPVNSYQPGMAIAFFSLLLHYLHEISFYSKLFESYAQKPDTFTKKLTSALRGSGFTSPLFAQNGHIAWRIIQQYLAKEDSKSSFLQTPHINTENLHWGRANYDMVAFGKKYPTLGLDFWEGLDYCANFFKNEHGQDQLLSFNLMDNLMAVTSRTNILDKYMYHQQEALWNEMFFQFVGGEEKARQLAISNFDKGFILL